MKALNVFLERHPKSATNRAWSRAKITFQNEANTTHTVRITTVEYKKLRALYRTEGVTPKQHKDARGVIFETMTLTEPRYVFDENSAS